MQKKSTGRGSGNAALDVTALAAASLAGTIYQAKLLNRQARNNLPEETVVSEVISLWQSVLKQMQKGPK